MTQLNRAQRVILVELDHTETLVNMASMEQLEHLEKKEDKE